ncbi:MAG: hypothetical protein RLZZ417_1652 [Bacteroidota bacterium]
MVKGNQNKFRFINFYQNHHPGKGMLGRGYCRISTTRQYKGTRHICRDKKR